MLNLNMLEGKVMSYHNGIKGHCIVMLFEQLRPSTRSIHFADLVIKLGDPILQVVFAFIIFNIP